MCTLNYKTHDGLMKKTCDMKPCVKRRQGRPADLKYFYAAQFDFREEDNTDVDSDHETAATNQHGKIHRLVGVWPSLKSIRNQQWKKSQC